MNIACKKIEYGIVNTIRPGSYSHADDPVVSVEGFIIKCT